MQPGDIFYSPFFKFYDGNTSNKLFILLNNIKNANAGYFVLTTSQRSAYRKNKPGCYSEEGYYFFQKNIDWFDFETWILFRIYERTIAEILGESFRKNFVHKATIKKNNLKALIKCIKQSPDVMRRHKALLSDY
jgi:hypothetical protein